MIRHLAADDDLALEALAAALDASEAIPDEGLVALGHDAVSALAHPSIQVIGRPPQGLDFLNGWGVVG